MILLLSFPCSELRQYCVLTGVFHSHRCNNVLYIRGVEEEEEDGEMRE